MWNCNISLKNPELYISTIPAIPVFKQIIIISSQIVFDFSNLAGRYWVTYSGSSLEFALAINTANDKHTRNSLSMIFQQRFRKIRAFHLDGIGTQGYRQMRHRRRYIWCTSATRCQYDGNNTGHFSLATRHRWTNFFHVCRVKYDRGLRADPDIGIFGGCPTLTGQQPWKHSR